MVELVLCGSCEDCARVVPCGFASVPYLVCSKFGIDVGEGDGCTFGTPGEPHPGVVPYDVQLGLHPADFHGDC